MGVKQRTVTLPDRKVLAKLWAEGESPVEIAVKLGFSPSTIYSELKRGSTGELDQNQRPAYDPTLGQQVYQSNLRNRGRRGTEAKQAGGDSVRPSRAHALWKGKR